MVCNPQTVLLAKYHCTRLSIKEHMITPSASTTCLTDEQPQHLPLPYMQWLLIWHISNAIHIDSAEKNHILALTLLLLLYFFEKFGPSNYSAPFTE